MKLSLLPNQRDLGFSLVPGKVSVYLLCVPLKKHLVYISVITFFLFFSPHKMLSSKEEAGTFCCVKLVWQLTCSPEHSKCPLDLCLVNWLLQKSSKNNSFVIAHED